MFPGFFGLATPDHPDSGKVPARPTLLHLVNAEPQATWPSQSARTNIMVNFR